MEDEKEGGHIEMKKLKYAQLWANTPPNITKLLSITINQFKHLLSIFAFPIILLLQ